MNSEITDLDITSNGQAIMVTNNLGQIYFWDIEEGMLRGTIEGKRDIQGGRLRDDRMTSKNSTKNKHFNSVSYNPTGELLVGGGNSKYILSLIHI